MDEELLQNDNTLSFPLESNSKKNGSEEMQVSELSPVPSNEAIVAPIEARCDQISVELKRTS